MGPASYRLKLRQKLTKAPRILKLNHANVQIVPNFTIFVTLQVLKLPGTVELLDALRGPDLPRDFH